VNVCEPLKVARSSSGSFQGSSGTSDGPMVTGLDGIASTSCGPTIFVSQCSLNPTMQQSNL